MRKVATESFDFILTKFFNVKGLIHYSKDCEAILKPIVKTYEDAGALIKHATPNSAVEEVIRTNFPHLQTLTAQVEKEIIATKSHCGGGAYNGSGAHVYFQWQVKPLSSSVDMEKVNPAVARFFPGNKNFGKSPVVSSYKNGVPMELLLGSGDQVLVLNSKPYVFNTSSGKGMGYVFRTGTHALDGILFHANIQTATGHDVIVRIGLGHRHFLPGNSLSFPDRINSPAGIGLWSLADLLHDFNRLGYVGMAKAYGLETANTVRHIYVAMSPTYGIRTLLGEIGMEGWQTRGKALVLKKFVSVGGSASRMMQPVAKRTFYNAPFIYTFGASILAYLIWHKMYGDTQKEDSKKLM